MSRKWYELENLPLDREDCILWNGARDSSGHGRILYFGVSKGCISEIVYNKTWKGVE